VIKHTPEEVVLNRTFREFAEFYNVAVIPHAPYSPRGKASVESSVGKIANRIRNMLRDRVFFDFDELNEAIAEKLADLNSRPFQKRAGSRDEKFEEAERDALQPLPARPFEIARWGSPVKVPKSYHVLLTQDGVYYSVPHRLVNRYVEMRWTASKVEVFCDGERIAVHPRSAVRNDDVRQESHQPKWHSEFLQQSGERFRQRALDEIGPWGRKVADSMLSSGRAEEEGYRPCAKLLNLAARHGGRAVEEACERACGITRAPSLKTVKIILKNMPDRDEQRDAKEDYAILRDEGYYGGEPGANGTGDGGADDDGEVR
jgi:hypothetical protein